MHIAWIVPGFQGGSDEPGIPALNSLAHAIAAVDQLHVFAVRYPLRASRYDLSDVHVQSFGHAHTRRPTPYRRAASAVRWARVLSAIAAEHRRSPFAVIHGFWASESGMIAATAGRLLSVPVLISCCGGELASVRPANYGSRLHALERLQVAFSLHNATLIGVGSDDLRKRVLFRYPWLAPRIELLPLGFDPQIFGGNGLSERQSQQRILCIASWSPVKGHELLLDAMRILVQRGVTAQLLLVGERTDGQEAQHAVSQRGLDAHVLLIGHRSQQGVAEVVGNTSVLVISSWHEAQCLAVVEALACGVPVVSTPVGIARELLGDPRLGSCIATRSPVMLADALERELRLAREPEQQVVAARQDAVAHLTVSQVTQRFLTIYQRLAAGGEAVAM